MKAILLFLLTAAIAQAVQVKFLWDAPAQPAEDPPYTYNIYIVSHNNPVPGASIYIKVNDTPIAGTESMVEVQAGQNYIVRSFNGFFESEDSNILVVPPKPPPPTGLRVGIINIESSSNLKDWTHLAFYPVANTGMQKFFRLKW